MDFFMHRLRLSEISDISCFLLITNIIFRNYMPIIFLTSSLSKYELNFFWISL